eukprot:m.1282100 g.1282100  ORF g.1282100 m.1282100 type:complete len:79 (-) comp24775_c0_seq2:139-375(-)
MRVNVLAVVNEHKTNLAVDRRLKIQHMDRSHSAAASAVLRVLTFHDDACVDTHQTSRVYCCEAMHMCCTVKLQGSHGG